MAHRKLDNPSDVEEYAAYLEEGWPSRGAVIQHMCQRLLNVEGDGLHILELCMGPGALSEAILNSVPVDSYTGIDISDASVAFVGQKFSDHSAEVRIVQADLNGDEWLSTIDGMFDAVVSLQSVHDLGGESEVRRIYGSAHGLLAQDGLFLNADLLRQEDDLPGSNPGRFFAPQHVDMLKDAGFASVRCTLQVGGFACFEATKSVST